MVSVDVKHHVYLLIIIIIITHTHCSVNPIRQVGWWQRPPKRKYLARPGRPWRRWRSWVYVGQEGGVVGGDQWHTRSILYHIISFLLAPPPAVNGKQQQKHTPQHRQLATASNPTPAAACATGPSRGTAKGLRVVRVN